MDHERELDLLRDRAQAQGRRLDAVEQAQEKTDEKLTALDKAVAVAIVEVELLRGDVKSGRAVVATAAVGVIATAIGIVLFGGH